MKRLPELFAQNREWAANIKETRPDFFKELALQQKPEYLWIGCSDSRVPANEIVGMLPGRLFVHRNVANLVIHTDFNCLSVIQYAIDFLKIKHVIVCGHYCCGGVAAAMENKVHGLVDNWLRHVRDVYKRHEDELEAITDEPQRLRRLCELNVLQQVINVGETTVLQEAWERGQDISIHGWIYDVGDGLLRDLGVCVATGEEHRALQKKPSL